ERAAAVALGRELLEKEGRKMGLSMTRAEKEGLLQAMTEKLSLKSVDDLMADVGYARHTPKWVLRRMRSMLVPSEELEEIEATPRVKTEKKEKKNAPANEQKTASNENTSSGNSISVCGVDGMLLRFAKCCNPVPGDDIVGFISRGRGVIVHTTSCPLLQDLEPDRLISVQWDGHESQPFPVGIHMLCKNRKGMLADISTTLLKEDVNINSCRGQSLIDGRWQMQCEIDVKDVAHLYRVIDKLRHVPDMQEVYRKTPEEE
ncbi:MAG: bifunctional (p)ppGpp synthetase/guanosine-3',5'-bis(diphosphate) 3'-pyrophosphohydrolase, partial [Desulfovibrionaceae bacterium]|nr:bifunctional (p)ppGpp synthetase/guanosine-3',5'-bis(diphosphate) 3'-pyrophosphohydrolase [Desulfovibrionaceae bacterium]